MKIRNDREAIASSPLKITSLEKDPVLRHDETKRQVENTEVELLFFRWTYDHIENRKS
jgi:hypothetical protein